MRGLLFILFVCLWFPNLAGQVSLRTEEQVAGYLALPAEDIFVHTNDTFFLTGEYLYYKMYCFEGNGDNLTSLSKVAYVELVGKEGKVIFRHKIVLQNGQGHGDFFVPTNIASGSYKLIAYTNWMFNQGQDSFCQNDIAIVNPYRSNRPEIQRGLSVAEDSLATNLTDTFSNKNSIHENGQDVGSLRIEINGERFSKRDKVTLLLKDMMENREVSGDFSLSVRKKNDIVETSEYDISSFFLQRENRKNRTVTIGDSIALPELRGELLQGKVSAVKKDKSVKNLKMAVSIPEEDYVLEIVQTDASGNFLVNIDKSYAVEKLFLQVLSENAAAYKVQIKPYKILDYKDLDFNEININSSMREKILRRSIHNQIENSYFQFRPDSILTVPPKHFFDNKEKKAYVLDDYTRFKTLRETFVEIIQDVSAKRIGRENYSIRIKGYDYASITDIPPLILLDGCLIQDHNTLLAFDARTIDQVQVFRDTFIYGPDIYEGAMILTTKDGNGYSTFQKTGFISTAEIRIPQPQKKYYVQRYNKTNGDKLDLRLPDDRLQLLWLPELKGFLNTPEINFFTSDVSGEFEIRLEGVTDNKRPVSIRRSFTVE